MERLKEHLLVLIHLTSGLPARGPEIASIKFLNDIHKLRNVFLWHNAVLVTVDYNKSENVTDQAKVIARFLPHRVARLLVTYIVDIHPFASFVSGAAAPDRKWPKLDPHLFSTNGVRWDSNKLSNILGRETGANIGVQLTLAPLRHILIAIEQAFLRQSSRNLLDPDRYSANALMASHSVEVEEHHYAISAADLHGTNDRMLTAFFQISQQWHALWDLGEDSGR